MKNLTQRFNIEQQFAWFKSLQTAFLVLISFLFLSLDTSAQVTQVGTATTADNSGTTITITKPTGIQVGDVMLANIVQNDNSGGTDLDVNVTSPGWILIDGRHLGGTSPEWWGTILYKIAVLADVSASNYVFTLDAQADGGIGGIVAFRNVNITGGVTETGGAGGPFDVDPGIINGIATDNSLTATAITTASANAAVILFGMMGDDDNDNVTGWTTTSPGALTELYEDENTNGDDQTVAAAWAIKAAPGTTGTGAATLANSNTNGSLLIALKGCTPPTVNPIGGGATIVCIGAMTPAFTNTTPGGVWSTSNTGIATINSSGVATGVANGTVNVIYTVTDMSGCSASATKALTVGVPAQPSAITGPASVAPNAMGVAYSVTNVPGVTYTWAFSPGGAGWTIATGQGSSSITINAGTIFPQTLTVTPSNVCGNGTPRAIVISNADCTAPVYCTQCNTSCNEPIDDNPDLMGSCASLKVVLVIDESTSIGGSEGDVEAGVLAFVNTLSCTGVQLAVVEFNNQARFVLDTSSVWYHNVDNTVVTAIGAYNTNGTNSLLLNSADYSPNSGTNYTNWHAAMLAVDHIPEPPNLVIFFTDGVPTKVYLSNPPPNFGTDGTQCGGTGDPELAEFENPAKVANKLKCEGVHMFMAGVGGIVGNEEYLEQLSGTTQYVNGINDITNSDYATGAFAELALGLATFVSELCPFNSEVSSQDICPGGTNGSITITLPGNLLPYNYDYYNDDTNVLLGSGNNIFTNPLVISGLTAGNYRIEVEVTLPGSGCTRTEIFFETISAGAVEVVASVTSTTQPSCANPDNGSATVTITAGAAPYTITLKKGGVTEPGFPIMTNATMYTATGLDAGSYTFEIKDVNNCNTDIDAFTLNPASGCCPTTCTVTGGPGGNICPNTQSTFGVTTSGGTCTTPAYSWSIISNTSGATIVGSSTSASVTISSGTTCGSYTIQSSVTCSGCSPLICTQVVNVVDITAPSFTFCPAGSDLGCNPSGLPAPGAATATDNCGTPTITNALGSIVPNGCLRTQTRTYTATDACGNTATCAQVFTWTVDITAPTFTFCPVGSDLGCNPSGVPGPGAATATDACGTPTIINALGSIIPNGCLRTQTRTYTATDGCGNTATCTQVFTWTVDITAPVFTFCPTGSDLGCNPSGVPAPGAATATDACGTPTITNALGSIIPNGCLRTQTRTYTATDGCGNTATCTQVFTWTVDITPPTFTFCPVGSELGCNPSGVPAPGAATATDACGTPTITNSLGSIITNGCLRTQTRTYTATDGCGNTATCAQVFTWTVDITAPTFTFCPVGSDLGCNPSGIPAPGAATATDACGTPTITNSLGSVIPNGCLRTQTRTYTATDGCGNTATCAQVFTWTVDITAPTFTFCPVGSELGCNPSGVPAPGAATATDACGTPTITNSLGSIMPNGCLRTQTRTYTATDGCGNTATCTQVFTWTVDTTPPTFTFCPVGSDLGCNPSGIPAPGAATATDACGTPTITNSLGSVIPNGCLRTQTRTYTATDGCGNTATCTQVFTWTVDTTPPTFTFCPVGSELGCNPSGIPAPGAATATDACGTPTITNSLGSIIPNGCLRTQTRTYTATDGCGNTATCTQVFTWTVDTTPPVFTFVPDDYTALCSETLEFVDPTGSDNCSALVTITEVRDTVPENNPSSYVIIRTFTIVDGCGNINPQTEQQVITVIPDNVKPVALVDSVEAVQGELIVINELANDSDPNSVLNPASLMIITAPLHGIATANMNGTINYTPAVNYVGADSLYYKICDDGVNCEVLCDTAKIYIHIEARSITSTGTTLCEMDAAYFDYLVVADNFVPTGGVTIKWLDMSDNLIATYTNLPLDSIVIWPGCIVDMNGQGIDWPGWVYMNNEWVQTADGFEGLRPQAKVILTVNPSDTLILNYPPSSPFCYTSPPDIETFPDSGVTCVNTPITINVLTNDSSHFGVVIDPSTLMILEDPINGSAVANLDSTITYTPDLGFEGVDTLVYIICDTSTIAPVCAKAYVFITVQDNIAPIIVCPDVISPIECPAVPSFGIAQATDDCDPSVTITFNDVTLEGSCLAEYTIVRTWIATDDAGNTATCSRTITVEDNTSPTLTCPEVISPIECPSEPVFAMATATDNCDPNVTVTYTEVAIPGLCIQEYNVIRTWLATDDCGNTATCSRTIAVQDNTPPSLTCPSNVTIESTESTLPSNTGIPVVTDACDPSPTRTFNDQIFDIFCPQTYTIFRTWSTTDACGNSNSCLQLIRVEDTTPPECFVPNLTVTIDPDSGYVIIHPVQFEYSGLIDSIYAIDFDSFTCDNAGLNFVNLTLGDFCGNTTICTVNVTVLECFDPCVRLNTGVYLEGAATDPSGLPNTFTIPMRTNLNILRILPGQTLMDPFFGNKYSPPGQPYNIAPWNYTGSEGDTFDSEGDPLMGDAGYPATAVDWVLVSLRADSAGTGGPVCQAAALLHNNGYIQFVAPFECCDVSLNDSFYIVVEHRNHLITMSHMKLPIVPGVDSSTISYDFRNQQSYEDDPFGFGVFSQKEITPGIFAMFAGNGDQTLSAQSDTDINFDDRSFWELGNGDIGQYRSADYNLNGDTNFNDRLTWERNNGSFTSVPRD